MERITRAFATARLNTTTNVMRENGMLATNERLEFEQTGSDRYPWQLVIMATEDDGARHHKVLTGMCTWQMVNVAIDTAYELAWHRTAIAADS